MDENTHREGIDNHLGGLVAAWERVSRQRLSVILSQISILCEDLKSWGMWMETSERWVQDTQLIDSGGNPVD